MGDAVKNRQEVNAAFESYSCAIGQMKSDRMFLGVLITITFNAFSFLQAKLRSRNIEYSNARLDIPEGTTARELAIELGVELEDIEGVFVNHRVVSMRSILHNNDCVAFFPPGLYRGLLGMVQSKKK